MSAPPTSATSTSQKAARSASRCPGALEFWACCTNLTIWARAVSAPTRVARTRRVPLRLIVAPMTVEPGCLCTGRLSPVTMDSSTSLSPPSTTPSTGILTPGRTSDRSPSRTSAVGTSTGSPSRRTVALGGARSSRVRMARGGRALSPTVIHALGRDHVGFVPGGPGSRCAVHMGAATGCVLFRQHGDAVGGGRVTFVAGGWGVRLGHRIADVRGHRLTGAVIPAFDHPGAQLGQTGAGWVEHHGRRLGHRVDLHLQPPGRRPRRTATTFCSEAHRSPLTSRTAVLRSLPVPCRASV